MANEEQAVMWRKRLDDFAQSGLSVRKWCEEKGLSKNQYSYWRRKLANSDTAIRAGAGSVRVRTDWLPVQLTGVVPTPVPHTRLTLRIAGAEIDLQAGFDPVLLRTVVFALGIQPC